MKISFLGSGCIIPQPDRLPSSYLIEQEHQKILVDMGPGIFHKLYKHIGNPFLLDNIVLTHFHQDHLADLWPWLFARIWAGKYFAEIKPTRLIVHPSFADLWETKLKETDVWLEKVEGLEITALSDGDDHVTGPLRLQAYAMNHKPESLGYRITIDNKTVAFSGDTGDHENLIPLFDQADAGIIECSFDDENPVQWHLYPSAINRLLEKISIGKIFVSHLYPGTADSDSLLKLTETYPCCRIAEDGMFFEV